MFTGIVQTKAKVAALQRVPFGVRLTIDPGSWTPAEGRRPIEGDSVCISGVCLTVAGVDGAKLTFDVIAETLDKTMLGTLDEGSYINIEPSVTPQQPLGGHFMQGHVDGVGEVTAIVHNEEESRITVRPPAELMMYMIPKGSVAIDGVSLTLAAVHQDTVEVALIPTTLQITTLGEQKVGDTVNLEADILAKTIVATLQRMRDAGGEQDGTGQGVTMDLLRQAGFAE